jgi:hypothetical protein
LSEVYEYLSTFKLGLNENAGYIIKQGEKETFIVDMYNSEPRSIGLYIKTTDDNYLFSKEFVW